MDEKFEYKHVFHIIDKSSTDFNDRNWKQKFWQIFPVICASLLAVPFGITLGWPSPTYPYLLQTSSVIPISLSQSAMIAGFLMLGVTLATPVSSKYLIGPKYGIWTGLVLILAGWFIMLYSRDIFWLLGSRLVVGLGSGFGMGQIKNYINELCEEKLALTLTKQLNFYVYFGVIISFITGTFLDFRQFCYVPIAISFVLLLIVLFLPCTPKDFVKCNKTEQAIMLLNYLRGKKDHTNEIKKIETEMQNKNEYLIPILKNKTLRIKFIKFIFLVFLQQFAGAPTTIIYCQIIFTRSGGSQIEYCAILYSIIFFTSNIYGTFFSPKLNKKIVMIFSCISSSLMLVTQILVLYFEINQKFWPFTSFVVMILYISFYCVGIGNIPFTYIPVWFPKYYKSGIASFFVMEFSMCALVATKIFQVFITAFPLYVGFCMFLIIDLTCLIFILGFVENESKSKETYVQSNAVYFWNANGTRREKSIPV